MTSVDEVTAGLTMLGPGLSFRRAPETADMPALEHGKRLSICGERDLYVCEGVICMDFSAERT